jgi:hypothetical protein
VFDVAQSVNISHKAAKMVRRMQPLNTDLFQNELSYWSLNIIYASIQYVRQAGLAFLLINIYAIFVRL